jgi:hypothetical protein
MNTTDQIPNLEYKSAPTIKTPIPRSEEIGQCAQLSFVPHSAADGTAPNDRLQPLKNSNIPPASEDLTIGICSEDGSHTEFYQNDQDHISKILRLLISPRLFTQPVLTLASERSISIVPCRSIDLILVRIPRIAPLLLPAGWLDIVEVGAVAFHDESVFNVVRNGGAQDWPQAAQETASYVEIHTAGDWMIILRLRTAIQATIQDQRQLLARFFDLPYIPFRLEAGGVGFINPAKISRVTVYPAFAGVGDTGLPAELLRSVRS